MEYVFFPAWEVKKPLNLVVYHNLESLGKVFQSVAPLRRCFFSKEKNHWEKGKQTQLFLFTKVFCFKTQEMMVFYVVAR